MNINERFKVNLVIGSGGFDAVNFGAALCIAKPVDDITKGKVRALHSDKSGSVGTLKKDKLEI